jgi:GST-like protein
MKTLYTWNTPNGRKISIALEEMALNYTAVAIDITKDQQFSADFLSINPNNKIPALVEGNGLVINESNAILLYLAQQTQQFTPAQDSPEHQKCCIGYFGKPVVLVLF